MEARRPRGMHTYCEYTTHSHLPSVLIIPVQSSMPLDAAVLAAPIQRVWLQYFSLSRPTPPSPSQQNGVLLTLFDFWSWNNGPGVPSQLNVYSLPLWPPDIDRSTPVQPTQRVTPIQKGPVFDSLEAPWDSLDHDHLS